MSIKYTWIYIVFFFCMMPFEGTALPDKGVVAAIPDEVTALPPMIFIPRDRNEWGDLSHKLDQWRSNTQKQLQYDDYLYTRRDFEWCKKAFNCYFLMMYDEMFYDREKNAYRINDFLARGEAEFGGYDIVVLWHAYPRIGLDDRNQFDFYRDMPGGLEGVKSVADELHKKGKKVFINYNPWDTGTRREGQADIDALAAVVKAIGADGIFLDTMDRGAAEFRSALDDRRKGVVLESELSLPIEGIGSHHMSWAQWMAGEDAPGILRNKWFERRHMQHQISRWKRSKARELLTAWFNGSGTMIWENVFGQWVGWNEKDKSTLRQIVSIQRKYAGLFAGDKWNPFAGNTINENVYAGLWHNEHLKLWTLINWSDKEASGQLLQIEKEPGIRYFDLMKGTEVYPTENGRQIGLSGKLSSWGAGCFIAIPSHAADSSFISFLTTQSRLSDKVVSDTVLPLREPTLKPQTRTIRATQASPEMVVIPPVKTVFETTFRVREVGYYKSIGEPFIDAGPPPLHYFINFKKQIDLPRFAIDKTPVTNAEFQKFIQASGYKPACEKNYLKHWINGKIPEGKEDHPVVYIHLDDARAYARWCGKRLPTEYEWQHAAQGGKEYNYPWGNDMDNNLCNGETEKGTTPVLAYPAGKSPYGCYDMCGNTWELTESEYSDGRTRFCILKGGSFYRANGSEWYFDGGPQKNNFSAKQILIYPGIDRCATIGFRCAADL